MTTDCPTSLDPAQVRRAISSVYARVAENPNRDFHFHRGPAYAATMLGYDPEQLATLPSECTAAFAGIGNPLSIDELSVGQTVVDIGCGSGMDLLLAGLRVGDTGRAIGIDITPEMLAVARAAASELGLAQVQLRTGDAEQLPVDTASADVVISNGVLNLTTDKRAAFAEILRVLKPGGRLLLADIALAEPLADELRSDIDLWAT